MDTERHDIKEISIKFIPSALCTTEESVAVGNVSL